MRKGRIEAFSDGVFAIAITLLVLTIPPPDDYRHLGDALWNQWPAYAAYVVSFAVIGIMWLNHHTVFDHFERVDRNLVYLNLAPGLLSCTDVLTALATAIPIEAATIMDTNKTGPYVLPRDPEIWDEFAALLKPTDCAGKLDRLERFAFYDAARSPDVALIIATGERRIYANLLLTVGVVR